MTVNGKKLRRKSKSAAVYIPVAAILILLLTVLGTSVFLRIDEIVVSGASKYSKEEIIAVSGIKPGVNIFRIKADDVSRQIRSEMPYINRVDINYLLPDKVRITVRESVALAKIELPGGVILIDSAGMILEQAETSAAGLIEIKGFMPVDPAVGSPLKAASAEETKLRYLQEILEAVAGADIKDDLSYIDVSNISHISLKYMERFNVVISATENIRYKLSSLPEIASDIMGRESNAGSWTVNMFDNEPWRWFPDNQN